MPSLDEVFASQLGLVTRAQAVAAGLSSRQLDGGRRGAWDRVHPGVFRHRSFPVTAEQRLLAGVLAAGPGAVVSHRAAAALHGLERFRCDLVELTVPRRSIVRVAGAVVHRRPDLEPRDTGSVGVVPVTRPAPTLADLGAVTTAGLVARALEQWLATRVVRPDDLDDVLRRRRGRAGAGVLRRVWEARELADEVPDSVAEGELARLLVRHGLPRPVHHLVVTTSGGRVYELDWAYPEHRIALEVDGYGPHMRSSRAFARDRERANHLRLDGWLLLQFAASTVARHRAGVVRQVREALARAATATVAG